MILPRRLMTLADGRFCEEHDPKQAMNFRPKGFVISDTEAERIGLKAYLDATGYGEVADEPKPPLASHPAAKAVEKAETEDKAVHHSTVKAPAEDEEEPDDKSKPGPGLHIDTTERRPRRSGERDS